jgi:hypothetical protein
MCVLSLGLRLFVLRSSFLVLVWVFSSVLCSSPEEVSLEMSLCSLCSRGFASFNQLSQSGPHYIAGSAKPYERPLTTTDWHVHRLNYMQYSPSSAPKQTLFVHQQRRVKELALPIDPNQIDHHRWTTTSALKNLQIGRPHDRQTWTS